MVELVIKMPESEIPKQQDIIEIPLHFIDGKVCEVGGYEFDVLPKGHGDLIDRSKLLIELECGIRAGNYEEGYEKYPHINDMDDCFDTVKYADTIIEADKAESEG